MRAFAKIYLIVWTIGTRSKRPLVRRQIEILEHLLNVLGRVLHHTLLVGVFDAKYEIAVVLLGEQVIYERGSQASDVHEAGRTGSKANANGLSIRRRVRFAARTEAPANEQTNRSTAF